MSKSQSVMSKYTFTTPPVFIPKVDYSKPKSSNIDILSVNPATKNRTNVKVKKFESKKDIKIRHLKEEFELAKNEQGIIGKAWNGLKNVFKTEYSSSNIEKLLNNLSSSSSEEEITKVETMINEFRSKQDLAVDTVATTCSAMTVGAAGAKVGGAIGTAIGSVIPGAGNLAGGAIGTILGFAGGAIVGAISNVVYNQVENMTDNIDNNSWQNDKNIKNELSSGAILGTIMMISGGISKTVSGSCKQALGVTKQGVVLTNAGTANVVKTVAYSAVADAAGGAASTTAISDGKYLIMCTVDKNTEFSLDNLIQTTVISGVSGGVINAVFGGVRAYSKATNFNNNLSAEAAESLKRTSKNSSKIKRGINNTAKFVKKNARSIVKRSIKSNFKKSLKNAIRKGTVTPVKTTVVPVKTNVSSVKSTKPGIIYDNSKSNNKNHSKTSK